MAERPWGGNPAELLRRFLWSIDEKRVFLPVTLKRKQETFIQRGFSQTTLLYWHCLLNFETLFLIIFFLRASLFFWYFFLCFKSHDWCQFHEFLHTIFGAITLLVIVLILSPSLCLVLESDNILPNNEHFFDCQSSQKPF